MNLSDHEVPVFFVGAGISGESGMPLGHGLTRQWLDWLLPDGESGRVIDLFERTAKFTGKSSPRLEKVVGDAVSVFGPPCLEVLRFLENCPPNRFHRLVAATLAKYPGSFAFTTNFDRGIEEAGTPFAVHVDGNLSIEQGGLVKLHGTIAENLNQLGVTIQNLENGLSPAYAKLLRELASRPGCVFIFAGYSGTDYFDIIPFFRSLASGGEKIAASALWICHDGSQPAHQSEDGSCLTDGAAMMLDAFPEENFAVWQGDTYSLCCEWLRQPEESASPPAPVSWHQGWAERFTPSDATLKWLFAARLYTSSGCGREALRLMRRFPEINWGNYRFQALRDCGFLRTEARAREIHDGWGKSNLEITRQKAIHRRLSGLHIASGFYYAKILLRTQTRVLMGMEKEADRQSALSGVLEAGLYALSLCQLRPGATWAFFTWPARCVVMLTLRRYQWAREFGWPQTRDTHLIMLGIRLSALISRYPGRLVSWLDQRAFGPDLPLIEESIDQTGSGYEETDSLLGTINFSRAVGRGWLDEVIVGENGRQIRGGADIMRESWRCFRESWALANIVGDLQGQRKALLLMARVAPKLGFPRRARRLRFAARRCEKLRRKMDREWLAGKPPSLWQRAEAWLYGWDCFISYRWSDGRPYAEALAEKLKKEKFDCFLDSSGYLKGDNWQRIGKRELKKTSRLVLVGSPEVHDSHPVARELEVFGAKEGRVIAIEFGDSLSPERFPESLVLAHLDSNLIRQKEPPEALGNDPSDEVIAELRRTFEGERVTVRRLRVVRAVGSALAGITLLLLVAAIVAAIFFRAADREKAIGISRMSNMLQTQAELQIQQGRPNEAIAYLARVIDISPDSLPASIRLRSMLDEWSYFTRDKSRSANRTGVLLDSVSRKDRDELIYALNEDGQLRIYSSERREPVASWQPGHQLIGLSEFDNLAATQLSNGEDSRSENALFRWNGEGALTRIAALPDEVRWVRFLKDGRVLLATDTHLHFHQLGEGDEFKPDPTPAVLIPRGDTEVEDNRSVVNMVVSESERYAWVVQEIAGYDGAKDVLFGIPLFKEDTAAVDPSISALSIETDEDYRFWDVRTLSIGNREYVIVAEDGRYRNKLRGGEVRIYEREPEAFRMISSKESTEGLNTVIPYDETFLFYGTDQSRMDVLSFLNGEPREVFPIVSRGFIQSGRKGWNDSVWLIKTDRVAWPDTTEPEPTRIIVERWKLTGMGGGMPSSSEIGVAEAPVFDRSSENRFRVSEDEVLSLTSPTDGNTFQVRDSSVIHTADSDSLVDLSAYEPRSPLAFALNDTGTLLAIGGGEVPWNSPAGYMLVVNARTLTSVAPVMTHEHAVVGLGVNRDGNLLAVVSLDGPPLDRPPTHIQIWQPETNIPLTPNLPLSSLLKLNEEHVPHNVKVRFSDDSKTLYLRVEHYSYDSLDEKKEIRFFALDLEPAEDALIQAAEDAASMLVNENGFLEILPTD